MISSEDKDRKTPGRRQLRVAEIIRHALAGLLQRFPVQNPQNRQIEVMITVTAVNMSPDLKNAKVFVRAFHSKSLPKDWLKQLRLAKGQLRSTLNLDLKFTPNLHFTEDESFNYADKIEHLIAEDHARYQDDKE